MGFFKKAFGFVARAAGTVLGIVPPVAAAKSVIARSAPFVKRNILPAAVAGATFGAADIAVQTLAGGGAAPARIPGVDLPGGNGQFVTQTVVVTMNAAGEVVNRRVLQGSPFLMNRDLAIAKRVLRTAGKLGQKFSRKARTQSKRSQLLNAIEDKAISRALGVDCPS